MSQKVDRKLEAVRIAEYRYRHEAEFAAGFLEDAGIPYRLQLDDAGGADLGLSMLHPSAIWVRSVDAGIARELLSLEADGPDTVPEPAKAEPPPVHRTQAEGGRPGLSSQERWISAALSVAFLSAVPYLPYGPYRPLFGSLCLAAGVAFFAATALGRAPRPLERIVRLLSGSHPE